MMEKIGSVVLDDSCYPGEDYYCDGAVEDELLEIVRNHRPAEFPRIIEERKSWPILYHLSPLRENIVNWLPLTGTDKVLEVGSGCGAITGCLCRKAGSVTGVDLSRKRSLINACRHRDCGNLTLRLGNFTDVEPGLPADYDYILLIGVLEYGQCYIRTQAPFADFLKLLQKHLKPQGRLVIAIENRWGLKYWAGCREDHLGTFFSGLEGYQDGGEVRTFTRRELEEIFDACGAKERHFYYPYPDYKFMETLYSDERLPERGELSRNLRNFDRDRLLLFDEKRVFDSILGEGLFPLYSNSYLAVLGPGFPLRYSKFSNDRAEAFQIRTDLYAEEDGGLTVEKHPLTEAAEEHVENISTACQKLQDRFSGSGLEVAPCVLTEGDGAERVCARLAYVEGQTLEKLLDACLERDDFEGFHALFDQYLTFLQYRSDLPVVDYDLIFGNILVNGENWTVIDYEWTFGNCREPREIAFRALYCYVLADSGRERIGMDGYLKELGIDSRLAAQYREQELAFQKYVTGERLSLGELRERIGYPASAVAPLLEGSRGTALRERMQIYEDRGEGFREEDSRFLEETEWSRDPGEAELLSFGYPVAPGVRALRLDPCMSSCLVELREIRLDGESLPCKGKSFSCNGRVLGKGLFAFATEDPGFTFRLKEGLRENVRELRVTWRVTRVPAAVAQQVGKMRLG